MASDVVSRVVPESSAGHQYKSTFDEILMSAEGARNQIKTETKSGQKHSYHRAKYLSPRRLKLRTKRETNAQHAILMQYPTSRRAILLREWRNCAILSAIR